MGTGSDEKLDRLLRDSYPPAEVSPDFTFRLWKRLMSEPLHAPWFLPVPVLGLAAAVGIVAGLWTWQMAGGPAQQVSGLAFLRQTTRLDFFGNAPFDSVAGGYLGLSKEIKV